MNTSACRHFYIFLSVKRVLTQKIGYEKHVQSVAFSGSGVFQRLPNGSIIHNPDADMNHRIADAYTLIVTPAIPILTAS
jgi:hypothetical protein